MSLTVNLYYTGENGSALAFVRKWKNRESPGQSVKKKAMRNMTIFSRSEIRKRCCSLTSGVIRQRWMHTMQHP